MLYERPEVCERVTLRVCDRVKTPGLSEIARTKSKAFARMQTHIKIFAIYILTKFVSIKSAKLIFSIVAVNFHIEWFLKVIDSNFKM